MKTLIVVILYNKLFCQSKTLISLCHISLPGSSLLVVNNGPELLDEDDEFLDKLTGYDCVDFINSNSNRPLSHIYNEVLEKQSGFERYILLDDDTSISKEYFSHPEIGLKDLYLVVPRIIDIKTGLNSYPQINRVVYTGVDGFLPLDKDVLSIGSGLIIYRKLIDLFSRKKIELFDSNFALYGVDMSIFRKINRLNKISQCVPVYVHHFLVHEMSSTSGQVSEWRKLERLYDEVLSCLYYSKTPFHMMYNMSRLFLKEFVRLRFSNLVNITKAIINGRHPRC
ncbi:hypothetical protein GTPT_3208 [Tatumella ptyseos ATCC 33301]|uniref:Glycosyltransferase n=1 Tax=Tatumella ptyseos ATCC 33301 TaxID=1005995 RepID=A0A085JA75_9GAMM|nr:hypothetical protein [Tatumella ptyseos]KFD17371.1 hypothetical protein GTPT_3208 [Tatumella ptyseos ATCC 33301]